MLFPIAEGGAKIVGVFRVKNHDFTQKNHIFSNFRGGVRRMCADINVVSVSTNIFWNCSYTVVCYCFKKKTSLWGLQFDILLKVSNS
jgi:hypothetical protein